MEPWLLGVDAGGTRTQAALWQYGSESILFAEAGPGNPWTVGPEFAADAIEDACAQVLALGGMHLREVSSAVLGIAGYGRSGVPPGFDERIDMWGLPSASVITSDLDIATVSGLGERQGIHVVAGTGSALMVQLESGERIGFGGWGWFLGDGGSAFDVGWRAMRRWTENYDDGMVTTPFWRRFSEWSGMTSPRDLQPKLSDPGRERAWIASSARVVLDLAESGDDDARKVLLQSIESLVGSTCPAASRLPHREPFSLSFSGGMFHSQIFTDCYKKLLEAEELEFKIVNTLSNPIAGALSLAQKSLDLRRFEHLKDVIVCHYA